MNKRNAIALTDAERAAYLAEAPTIILVSVGSDGFPHAVPMWFLVEDDGAILMTTYRRSQKVVNLTRNPRTALLVESGTQYDQLRGVLMRGTTEVVDDPGLCVRVLLRVHAKHLGGEVPPAVEEVMRAQARKRVVLRVTPERIASWDHRRLGGAY